MLFNATLANGTLNATHTVPFSGSPTIAATNAPTATCVGVVCDAAIECRMEGLCSVASGTAQCVVGIPLDTSTRCANDTGLCDGSGQCAQPCLGTQCSPSTDPCFENVCSPLSPVDFTCMQVVQEGAVCDQGACSSNGECVAECDASLPSSQVPWALPSSACGALPGDKSTSCLFDCAYANPAQSVEVTCSQGVLSPADSCPEPAPCDLSNVAVQYAEPTAGCTTSVPGDGSGCDYSCLFSQGTVTATCNHGKVSSTGGECDAPYDCALDTFSLQHASSSDCTNPLSHNDACTYQCDFSNDTVDVICNDGNVQRNGTCPAPGTCEVAQLDIANAVNRDCSLPLSGNGVESCSYDCEYSLKDIALTCDNGVLQHGTCSEPQACDLSFFSLPYSTNVDCPSTLAHGNQCTLQCSFNSSATSSLSCRDGNVTPSLTSCAAPATCNAARQDLVPFATNQDCPSNLVGDGSASCQWKCMLGGGVGVVSCDDGEASVAGLCPDPSQTSGPAPCYPLSLPTVIKHSTLQGSCLQRGEIAGNKQDSCTLQCTFGPLTQISCDNGTALATPLCPAPAACTRASLSLPFATNHTMCPDTFDGDESMSCTVPCDYSRGELLVTCDNGEFSSLGTCPQPDSCEPLSTPPAFASTHNCTNTLQSGENCHYSCDHSQDALLLTCDDGSVAVQGSCPPPSSCVVDSSSISIPFVQDPLTACGGTLAGDDKSCSVRCEYSRAYVLLQCSDAELSTQGECPPPGTCDASPASVALDYASNIDCTTALGGLLQECSYSCQADSTQTVSVRCSDGGLSFSTTNPPLWSVSPPADYCAVVASTDMPTSNATLAATAAPTSAYTSPASQPVITEVTSSSKAWVAAPVVCGTLLLAAMVFVVWRRKRFATVQKAHSEFSHMNKTSAEEGAVQMSFQMVD